MDIYIYCLLLGSLLLLSCTEDTDTEQFQNGAEMKFSVEVYEDWTGEKALEQAKTRGISHLPMPYTQPLKGEGAEWYVHTDVLYKIIGTVL